MTLPYFNPAHADKTGSFQKGRALFFGRISLATVPFATLVAVAEFHSLGESFGPFDRACVLLFGMFVAAGISCGIVGLNTARRALPALTGLIINALVGAGAVAFFLFVEYVLSSMSS